MLCSTYAAEPETSGSLVFSSPTSSIGSPHVKFSQIRTFTLRTSESAPEPFRSSSSTRLRTLALSAASLRGGSAGSRWMSTRFGMNVERMTCRSFPSPSLLPVCMNCDYKSIPGVRIVSTVSTDHVVCPACPGTKGKADAPAYTLYQP